MQSSLQRQIQESDAYDRGRQAPAPGMKTRAPGAVYLALGLVLGAIGAARVVTLIPEAWALISGDCAQVGSAGLPRQQVAVGVIAGILAVICAEVGTRRENGRIIWLGMLGSVVGIFATLAGAALAFLLLLPTDC